MPAFPNRYPKLPIVGERQKGDVPAALLALAAEVIELNSLCRDATVRVWHF